MSKHVEVTVLLTTLEAKAFTAPLRDVAAWRTWVPEEDKLIRARKRAQEKFERAVYWKTAEATS